MDDRDVRKLIDRAFDLVENYLYNVPPTQLLKEMILCLGNYIEFLINFTNHVLLNSDRLSSDDIFGSLESLGLAVRRSGLVVPFWTLFFSDPGYNWVVRLIVLRSTSKLYEKLGIERPEDISTELVSGLRKEVEGLSKRQTILKILKKSDDISHLALSSFPTSNHYGGSEVAHKILNGDENIIYLIGDVIGSRGYDAVLDYRHSLEKLHRYLNTIPTKIHYFIFYVLNFLKKYSFSLDYDGDEAFSRAYELLKDEGLIGYILKSFGEGEGDGRDDDFLYITLGKDDFEASTGLENYDNFKKIIHLSNPAAYKLRRSYINKDLNYEFLRVYYHRGFYKIDAMSGDDFFKGIFLFLSIVFLLVFRDRFELAQDLYVLLGLVEGAFAATVACESVLFDVFSSLKPTSSGSQKNLKNFASEVVFCSITQNESYYHLNFLKQLGASLEDYILENDDSRLFSGNRLVINPKLHDGFSFATDDALLILRKAVGDVVRFIGRVGDYAKYLVSRSKTLNDILNYSENKDYVMTDVVSFASASVYSDDAVNFFKASVVLRSSAAFRGFLGVFNYLVYYNGSKRKDRDVGVATKTFLNVLRDAFINFWLLAGRSFRTPT